MTNSRKNTPKGFRSSGPEASGKKPVNFFLYPSITKYIKEHGGSNWIERKVLEESKKLGLEIKLD